MGRGWDRPSARIGCRPRKTNGLVGQSPDACWRERRPGPLDQPARAPVAIWRGGSETAPPGASVRGLRHGATAWIAWCRGKRRACRARRHPAWDRTTPTLGLLKVDVLAWHALRPFGSMPGYRARRRAVSHAGHSGRRPATYDMLSHADTVGGSRSRKPRADEHAAAPEAAVLRPGDRVAIVRPGRSRAAWSTYLRRRAKRAGRYPATPICAARFRAHARRAIFQMG